MKIFVVNAPSGVSLTSATGKILNSLTNPPGDASSATTSSVFIADVEDELRALYETDYPDEKLSTSGPMQDVLHKLPRDAVTQHYWPLAAKSALIKLLKANCDVRILRCHLTYYRDATREFYPAGDLEAALIKTVEELAESSNAQQDNPLTVRPTIALVLTLIDDIFDMFHRLSVQGQIYPLQELIKSEYRQRVLEGRDPPTDPSDQYVLAFEQVISTLHRLLEWRSREMTAGDVLASRSRAPHFVLGIKHPIETAVNLIRLGNGEGHLIPVYLSHPISRPRRDQKAHPSKEWGQFVTQFQTFVEAATDVEVAGKQAVFFMPTAIDEYRFAEASSENFPTLERRWPLIHHRNGLLYDLLEEGNYESFEHSKLLEEIFNPIGARYDIDRNLLNRFSDSHESVPKNLDEQAKYKVQGLIGGLLQQIRIQLSIRDHALVRQSGRLLLYRPLFDEGRLSGGVEAELFNWSSLLRYGREFKSNNKACSWSVGPTIFVHDAADLTTLESYLPRRSKDRLRGWLSRLPEEKSELFNLEDVEGPSDGWFDQALQPGNQLLTGGALSTAEREDLKREFNTARERYEREYHQMIRVGGAPLDGKDYCEYPRLSEQTHDPLQELARRDILPKLFAALT